MTAAATRRTEKRHVVNSCELGGIRAKKLLCNFLPDHWCDAIEATMRAWIFRAGSHRTRILNHIIPLLYRYTVLYHTPIISRHIMLIDIETTPIRTPILPWWLYVPTSDDLLLRVRPNFERGLLLLRAHTLFRVVGSHP